ncbi:MAG: phosphatidylglycerophosphatase A, partial [Myxococcales bacterium]|nr:phosphatidylglycerophosphatase A [Myxococcales bacterium]
MALFLATAGGVGFAPVAPGTFGSAVGVVLFPFVSGLGLGLLLLTTLALLSVGIWAADEAERVYSEERDAGNDAGLATQNHYQDFRFRIARVPAAATLRMRFVYYQP